MPTRQERSYFFDRHVSDVVLRLLLVTLMVPCLSISWVCWTRFDATLEGLFQRNIQLQVQLILKRNTKTGFSQETLFQKIEQDRLRDGRGVLSYPDYLRQHVDDKDPDYFAFTALILLHKVAMYLIAAVFTLLTLFLLYLTLISYGSGAFRWRLNRWLFRFFNTDRDATAPREAVTGLSPLQRVLFDECLRRAWDTTSGEFLFVEHEFYRLLHPSGDVEATALNALHRAVSDLIEQLHVFEFVRGGDHVTREYRLVAPVKDKVTTAEVEIDGTPRVVYKAGVFQIHPRLFAALRPHYGFVTDLDHRAAAVDHEHHPYAYALYAVLAWYRSAVTEGRCRELVRSGLLTLSLGRLLAEAGIPLPEGSIRDFLADVHADLDHMVTRKLIDSWEVREGGVPLVRDWFESVRAFTYDPDRRTYTTAADVVATKIYGFEMGLPQRPQLPEHHEVKRLPPGSGDGGLGVVHVPPAPEQAPAHGDGEEAGEDERGGDAADESRETAQPGAQGGQGHGEAEGPEHHEDRGPDGAPSPVEGGRDDEGNAQETDAERRDP